MVLYGACWMQSGINKDGGRVQWNPCSSLSGMGGWNLAWGMGKRVDRATTDGRLGGSLKGRQELLASRCNLSVPPGKWMLLV